MRWVGYPEVLGITRQSSVDWLAGIRRNRDRHHFVVPADGLGVAGDTHHASRRFTSFLQVVYRCLLPPL